MFCRRDFFMIVPMSNVERTHTAIINLHCQTDDKICRENKQMSILKDKKIYVFK